MMERTKALRKEPKKTQCTKGVAKEGKKEERNELKNKGWNEGNSDQES